MSSQHLQSVSDRNRNPSSTSPGYLGVVGEPLLYTTGQFHGKYVRMELHELQKAELGRKYATVDRRALDPPPVVQLKMFEVRNIGTDLEEETEMRYDDIQSFGLMCTVDLIQVPVDAGDQSHAVNAMSLPSTQYRHRDFDLLSLNQHADFSPSYAEVSLCSHTLAPITLPDYQPKYLANYSHPSPGAPHDFPVMENSKQTQSLAGESFAQPTLIEHEGCKAFVFVFADLAVKIEGTFIMRYRVFDIFSKPEHLNGDMAIAAETSGGTFRVYSTKDFPGLPPSTALSKKLSLWGVRLNIREHERKRKRAKAERLPTKYYY